MIIDLQAVIDERKAIKPLLPYLFKIRKGEPNLKPDKDVVRILK